MKDVIERQAMAAKLISDGCNMWQTFDSCRQLIALCMAMDHDGGAPDGAAMGMFRVLGMVNHALTHLEEEVRVLLKTDKEQTQSSETSEPT